MICPKCNGDESGVIRTIRGENYDLREVYCKNKKCNHIFYQKIEKISYIEFKLLKQAEQQPTTTTKGVKENDI
ncbi:MAG: hypothetical protein QXF70_03440 [Candidatus Bilamarchaeaceae archaeon]